MEKRKIGEWQAIVHFDEDNNLYTVSYLGEGGAIISNTDLKIAEKEFIEAMELAESVRKLLHFNEHKEFPS